MSILTIVLLIIAFLVICFNIIHSIKRQLKENKEYQKAKPLNVNELVKKEEKKRELKSTGFANQKSIGKELGFHCMSTMAMIPWQNEDSFKGYYRHP